jgi:hypothetical protein
MTKSVKVRLNRGGGGGARRVKRGGGVGKGGCLSQILGNSSSEFLTKEALEGFGDFKLGEQIIHTVKYNRMQMTLCY